MNEHPIIFSGEMVQAILEGRKVQTRRVVKPQPEYVDPEPRYQKNTWAFWSDEVPKYRLGRIEKCPYGIPGDHLWVRETWQLIRECGYNGPDTWIEEWPRDRAIPKSPPKSDNGSPWMVGFRADENPYGSTWRPSIFMPRWASHITLEVVGVRVERVQEISEQDAKQEGWPGGDWARLTVSKVTRSASGLAAIEWFIDLWDSINAKRGYSWDNNPWVWVVEFRQT